MTWVRKVTPLLYKLRSMTVTIEYSEEGELYFHGVGPDGSGQCDFTLLRDDGHLTLPGEGATFQDIYTPEIEEEDFLALLNGGGVL